MDLQANADFSLVSCCALMHVRYMQTHVSCILEIPSISGQRYGQGEVVCAHVVDLSETVLEFDITSFFGIALPKSAID